MKKVVLITGASSGMGKETALQLIKEGHVVYGAARRESNMQDLVEAGGHAVKLDITDEKQVKDVVEKVISEQGKIDVLVNNAGYAIYGAVEDITIDEARRQFEVNLFGLAAITKSVLPSMRKQKSGAVINISSMGGKMYTPLGAWYHATKHALEGWSDSLRLELKEYGINVVVIEPGIIKTEFDKVMYEPMLERSGNGAYANLTKAVAEGTVKTYKNGSSSPPSVVAKIISRAISSKKPKTRYVVGKMAKPMIWIRKNLGDRVFDALLMSQVK
jgi:short-subunit dehydrogenase